MMMPRHCLLRLSWPTYLLPLISFLLLACSIPFYSQLSTKVAISAIANSSSSLVAVTRNSSHTNGSINANETTSIQHIGQQIQKLQQPITDENNYYSGDLNNIGNHELEVVWLMSFPNSGTTYTNKLVQGISETTTATNYGKEQGRYETNQREKNSIPIRDGLPNGPFLRYPDWHRPSKYILTKTHCGGFCIFCPPERYILSTKAFERECRTGNKMVNGTETTKNVVYDSSVPKRAVHLIRNPFDNIVARLHHERKKWIKENNIQRLRFFTDTSRGFRLWCQYLDRRLYARERSSQILSDDIKEIFASLPCHSEFYRYVQWHNLALNATSDNFLNLPTHVIHYENYTNNWNATVLELLQFLHLEPTGEPPIFIQGKHYPDYFTPLQYQYAARLIKHVATPETWNLLRHYVQAWIE